MSAEAPVKATPVSSNLDLVLTKNEKSLPEDESKILHKKLKTTTRSTSSVFLVGHPMDKIAGYQQGQVDGCQHPYHQNVYVP